MNKPTGRPSVYTPELADDICARIEAGESVRAIGRDPDMPDAATIFRWASIDHEGFYEQYVRAKEIGAENNADEMEELAMTMDDVQRAKLVIDTRKWVMSKKLPKKYGDRIEVDNKLSGRVEIDNLTELSDEELAKLTISSEGGTSQAGVSKKTS